MLTQPREALAKTNTDTSLTYFEQIRSGSKRFRYSESSVEENRRLVYSESLDAGVGSVPYIKVQ